MSEKYLCLGAIALGALSIGVNAQDAESRLPVTLGFKVGIPITSVFSASNTDFLSNAIPGSSYTTAMPRYTSD